MAALAPVANVTAARGSAFAGARLSKRAVPATRARLSTVTRAGPGETSPPRFGKKLSAAQKERASHICVDCGYVYTLPTPFTEQGRDYVCPQCNAPRSRFAKYDVETGKAIGGSKAPLITTVSTVIGLAGIGYFLTQLL